jgi:uncharacterized protein (DUF305 family)
MYSQHSLTKRILKLSGLILAGGLMLSACSTNHDTMNMDPVSGDANAADVMFAQMMIPHHEQAVLMADLAPDRSEDPQVLALALEIKQAQAPEIELMTSWMETWGIELLPADEAMQAHGSHGMDGMLTDEQLADLASAQGAAFDELFAELMIEHHEGAVAMAQEVVASGQDPAVAQLAREIIATQEKEILQLRALLNMESSNQSMVISPAIGHIHGAIVGSDALILGTHDGVHSVNYTTGRTQRIGNTRDDMMAFAGDPQTMLVASGHPGLGSTLPNPLGLITSTDAGSSWTTQSLSGEVDFHSLAVNGSQLVGWDTRGFVQYSSDGGRTWNPGPQITATSISWFDNKVWIATVESGLVTWIPGSTALNSVNAPSVLVSASPNGEALWRVDQDGSVHRSLNGQSWEQVGSVNRIEAFAADTNKAYAVTGTSLEIINGSNG